MGFAAAREKEPRLHVYMYLTEHDGNHDNPLKHTT
jgi:hypothetical protein